MTKEKPMKFTRKGVMASTVLGSMAMGGFLGATVLAPSASNAATTSTIATSTAPAASGTFHSNENAAHEKTESAAREAQENAGQMPTVP
jgi:hypothetical protein